MFVEREFLPVLQWGRACLIFRSDQHHEILLLGTGKHNSSQASDRKLRPSTRAHVRYPWLDQT